MRKVFFKPWIGTYYHYGGIFGKKILILGEAHICGGCEKCGIEENSDECADFTTTQCMDVIMSGKTERWTGTFRKFEKSLVGHDTDLEESKKIWNSVSFYNYVQKSTDQSVAMVYKQTYDGYFVFIIELDGDNVKSVNYFQLKGKDYDKFNFPERTKYNYQTGYT